MYEFDTGWTLRRLGYLMPLWMEQGAGEVFASLNVRRGRGTIGDGPKHIAETWREGSLLPWERLFELSFGAAEYNGFAANGTAQAQSWALMHRVLLEGGREKFEALATRLRTEPALRAVEGVLGVPAKTLTSDIERHFRSRSSL